MKYFLRDALFYVLYGALMGAVGYMVGVDSGDLWIISITALGLITIGGEITKRFPADR